VQAEELRCTLSSFADEASGVALVDIDVGVVLLSELVYLIEGRDVAVHREDAVSDDHPHAGLLRLLQLLLQVSHVQVLESILLRLAQPDPIDDRRVVQGVADHSILGTENGLEETGVSVETAGEEDAVFD
jgi:hypothetical protein